MLNSVPRLTAPEPDKAPKPPRLRRINQQTIELYKRTYEYFVTLLVNTCGLIQAPPATVVEKMAVLMLDDVPWPTIDDAEWSFIHWPESLQENV